MISLLHFRFDLLLVLCYPSIRDAVSRFFPLRIHFRGDSFRFGAKSAVWLPALPNFGCQMNPLSGAPLPCELESLNGACALAFQDFDRTLTESQVDPTAQLSDVRWVWLGGPYRVKLAKSPHHRMQEGRQ